MKDDQTGSWWQQVSGEAIQGPLKGSRLSLVNHDEISFATWKHENPQGRVLQPDTSVQELYEPANWEERYSNFPVVTPAAAGDATAPRTLVYGISIGGASKAYSNQSLQGQGPVIDRVGQMPVLIVMEKDKKSVRAFDRTVDGRELEFFAKAGAPQLTLLDSQTGSEWDFMGKATNGPLKGRQLGKLAILADYWFDWKSYHPETVLYR
jgi:hypothetical protein